MAKKETAELFMCIEFYNKSIVASRSAGETEEK
jgi:hypothetical protein